MYTDEEFITRLNIILQRQLDDIFIACDKHADMLCLAGCMNMIEFIGGILNGKLGLDGESKSRFHDGFELFSDSWKRGIFSQSRVIFDKDDMWDLRCSLTHQFTAKAPKYQAVIVTGTENNEIIFWYSEDKPGDIPDDRLIVSIPVTGLTLELADARNKLLDILEQDKTVRDRANAALCRIPKISVRKLS